MKYVNIICEKLSIEPVEKMWYNIRKGWKPVAQLRVGHGGMYMANAKGLKIDARRKRIVELLAQKGEVRVSELSALFDATEVTIRNDLSALESDGYLQRVAGGAVQTVRNFYNLDYIQRSRNNLEYKNAIGRAVVSLIEDGQTLMINSGATTSAVAAALKTKRNLNIVTNSLTVAMEMGTVPTFRVILLGGEINVQYAFVYGSDTLEQLEHYKADCAILSVDGISAQSGLTTYHAEEAPVDRAMIRRVRSTIVAADYAKVGHESFSSVHGLGGGLALVTNSCADAAELDGIRAKGVRVCLCDDEGELLNRE